jgi:hypothetical protein
VEDYAVVADGKNVDPAGYGTARRAEAPGQGADVAGDVRWAILLEHELRWKSVDKLVDALANGVPSNDLRFCIDEPHVLGIRPLDRGAASVRILLQKNLVEVRVQQLADAAI